MALILPERRASLEHRLNDGYQRIEQAVSEGAEVAAWEVFWLDMLREYEAVCAAMVADDATA